MNRVEVVAAIIVNNGKLLLAQRPPQGDQAGLWEFPGGKIEPGETQPQALQRELHEELGINAQPESYVTSNSHPVNGRLI
ncbi:mutator protein MutT [Mangrovibacter plantisponsor]|uniref:Mutator protein MutT n=1 Tax=Mangrovibacter plantisponsor TaxID=451513 RepID=A0A317PVL4_9ENTR|nr:mutator protein MutT [Mangrovibacter plantisponsor]